MQATMKCSEKAEIAVAAISHGCKLLPSMPINGVGEMIDI